MKRWLLPGLLLLLAFGCGRKEAPEAVVQILPPVVAEPEETQEPEPVRKPTAAPQPDAVPDTAAADTSSPGAYLQRVITDKEFKRLPVCIDYWRVGYRRKKPTEGTYHELTGEEVERAGGIFEAVKTLPGVIGK